ncbi:MAG: N-acyl homoserine lactonase family protein [Candidatus Acidiferrales bacterium]
MKLSRTMLPLPDGRTLDLILPSYMIEMEDKLRVLVDTGINDDAVMPPGAPPRLEKSTVFEQLATLYLDPDDIDVVICTHFDVDHAGYHDKFPDAEFIVQREHYEIARHGNKRTDATRPYWGKFGLKYRVIQGDHEILPGVRLIETSGHLPGHQSVLVELPNTGKVLLAIDAVMFQSQFVRDRKAGPNDADPALTIASTHKLLDIVERENVALTVFGHDGAQWSTLKMCAEYYD